MDERLTKKEAIRRHRELWNKIAEMQEASDKPIEKDEALAALGYELDPPMHNCWCCEYTRQLDYCGCDFCPIEWPDLASSSSAWHYPIQCMNSYYRYWMKAVENEEFLTAVDYAKAIAELPEADFADLEDEDNQNG